MINSRDSFRQIFGDNDDRNFLDVVHKDTNYVVKHLQYFYFCTFTSIRTKAEK